jgi:aminoglycoside 6'-N-acetyltransferase
VSAWRFRPLARSDFPLLGHWLRQPHVARWWADDSSLQGLEADYGGCVDGTEPAEVFIALRDGVAAGLVQRYALAAYPEYLQCVQALLPVPEDAWSIDYLMGDAPNLRRGWGAEMLRAFCEALWREQPQARCVLVPVHAANEASSRLLRQVGFREAARGELEPDNPVDTRDHVIWQMERP